MDIEMKELEAFVSVMDQGSFSKAAEALHLTQPTVSAAVASLERKLGNKLFVRSTKVSRATDAGALFCPYAREILRVRADGIRAMEDYSAQRSGTISLAASTIPGQYCLPRLMQQFRSLYPEIHFHLQLLDSRETAELVAARKAELGFTGTALPLPGCTYEALQEDALVLLTPNTPAYGSLEEFPLSRLREETFLFREPGSGTRRETEAFFRSVGINSRELRCAAEAPSNETICQMVREGMGVAILSRQSCLEALRAGALLAFDLHSPLLNRKLYLVRHKSAVLSPNALAFYRFVRRSCQETENAL